MPGATLTTVDAILKNVYQGRIEDQLQNEVTALKRLERTSDGVVTTVGGHYVDFPIRVSRNAGIGARSEGEALPTAGQQGYAEVHVPLLYEYGTMRITKQTMALAEANHQAFASALDREMDGLKSDLMKDCARQAYGDGTGKLATVTSDGASNVTNVDNIQYLEVGMVIDILNTSTGADGLSCTSRTITAVTEGTYPAGSITYSGADVTTTTSYSIFRAGNFASGTSREVSGFNKIVSASATLHGLTVAAQPKWAAIEMGNSGTNRALSEGLMIEACDKARRNGGKPSVFFTSLGVRRAYFNLLTQQRRFTDTKSFSGGFKGLPFNYGEEIPVVEDVDCPPYRMYGIEESAVKIYRNKPWHWADEDGSVLSRVSGYDIFEAYMRQFWEIGTDNRNHHVLIKDITEG